MKNVKKRNKVRIARPLGLTLLAQQTRNQSPSPEVIQRIIQYVLSNNLQVGNKQLTIETLANYLHISKHVVLKSWVEYNDKLGRLMLGNEDKMKGALFFMAFQKTLASKAQIEDQIRILQASQGGTYKAFISSEVNKALDISMKADKAILDLYKAIQGPTQSAPNPINIQNNIQTNVGAIKAIGINEALQILQDQGLTRITYDEAQHQHLIGPNNLTDVPEVRATHQARVRTDGIMEDRNLKTRDEAPNLKVPHEDRRAEELGLDLDNHID